MRRIAHQKPIRGNLNLPHKPLKSIISRADLSTEWSAEKASNANIIIHHHYHPPHHRHHNHHQHAHHYHHLIIIMSGSNRRSIIIISSIFIIITSTSSPSPLSSHHHYNHYKTIFIIIIIIIVVVVIIITTLWNKNMVKKRWTVCQILLFYFTIYKLKRSSLKKGLNFNINNINRINQNINKITS